ncbi:MAG: hypothetical protein WCJ36_01295 [Candidatus Saccharibacteria bacterium]
MSNIINIQDPKPRARIYISRKKRLIIIVVFVLLVGIGVGVWWYLNNSSTKNTDKANSSGTVENIVTGKYSEGQAALDKSISGTADPGAKAWMYIQKSSIALNSGDYINAYSFAKKAEELKPDRYSAQMMADAAVKKGDIADAITKYKLSISRITGTSGMDKLDTQELQGKISKLEAQK